MHAGSVPAKITRKQLACGHGVIIVSSERRADVHTRNNIAIPTVSYLVNKLNLNWIWIINKSNRDTLDFKFLFRHALSTDDVSRPVVRSLIIIRLRSTVIRHVDRGDFVKTTKSETNTIVVRPKKQTRKRRLTAWKTCAFHSFYNPTTIITIMRAGALRPSDFRRVRTDSGGIVLPFNGGGLTLTPERRTRKFYEETANAQRSLT